MSGKKKPGDPVPAPPGLPQPGDPGFDYEAAFYDQQDVLRGALDRLVDVEEHNRALLEAAVGYTDEPMRVYYHRVNVQRNTFRNEAERLRRDNATLTARIAAALDADPAVDLGEGIGEDLLQELGALRQKTQNLGMRNANKARAMQEALDLLDQPQPDLTAVTDVLEEALTAWDRKRVRGVGRDTRGWTPGDPEGEEPAGE